MRCSSRYTCIKSPAISEFSCCCSLLLRRPAQSKTVRHTCKICVNPVIRGLHGMALDMISRHGCGARQRTTRPIVGEEPRFLACASCNTSKLGERLPKRNHRHHDSTLPQESKAQRQLITKDSRLLFLRPRKKVVVQFRRMPSFASLGAACRIGLILIQIVQASYVPALPSICLIHAFEFRGSASGWPADKNPCHRAVRPVVGRRPSSELTPFPPWQVLHWL